MLEDRNNIMIFHWEIYSNFFANVFYCFSPPTWPPCTDSILCFWISFDLIEITTQETGVESNVNLG